MHNAEEIMRRLIEISEVKLAGGWRGWVAVGEAGRQRFTRTQWEELLAEPEKLLEGAERTLKSVGPNIVLVKYLVIGGRGVKAVIKRHRRGAGLREFFRSLGPPRGLRNFIAAVKMRQYGLPVTAPLAGLYRRRFLTCRESIYISEYVEGVNLYEFLKRLPDDSGERYSIMSGLSEQAAEIFAGLEERRTWHRDAKATNFIVSGDNPENYRLILTDMDGIKQSSSRNEDRQMRALWRLAASVMNLRGVYRTDYVRMFKAYCEKAGIPIERRREILEGLTLKAEDKFRGR